MQFSQINSPKLAHCPSYPEESWRKTNPELFFLPQSEVLNLQGNSATENLNNNFIPWKVSYRDTNLLKNKIHEIINFVGNLSIQTLEAEIHRVIFVEIGHGIVDIYASSHLKSKIEFSSSPMQAQSIAPNSNIGDALANRLKASSPHEFTIRVESVGSEVPLLLVTNHLNPNFSQCYTALKFILEKSSKADFILIDHVQKFAFLRHSIIVNSNAKLNQLWIYCSPNGEKNTVGLLERYVKLEENSKFNDSQIMSPNGNTRVTSNICFQGERAEAKSGVAILSNGGKFDYEPIQEHKASQGKSNLNLKMILSGRARCIFQGLVIIDNKATKTLAIQNNKNLLLSKNSRVDASPRLQILPNDVICKHGSATGELDSKQLYYMATRGFSEFESRKMIVKSFAIESQHNLELEGTLAILAENILDQILSKLP